MSGQHDRNPKQETLFSFELLVEYIRIERTVSDALAVGIRLLDFPTLLIYPPELRNERKHHDKEALYSFNRGKSCFFQMNLDTLHMQLSHTPLYVMILDVKEDIPKLVGTSLLSLAKTMDRLRQDASNHGVSTCSSYGERGLVCINNPADENVGSISLSFKLLIVGSTLPSHVTKSIRVYKEQSTQEGEMDNPDQDILNSVAVSTQTEQDPISQIPHTMPKEENVFDEDLAVFCPPHLYYCNSREEKAYTQRGRYAFFKPNSKVVTHDDMSSESETSSVMDQTERPAAIISESHEVSVNQNVLEEALRPLPLLNALLVELSQLNVQNLNHQPLFNHPNLDRMSVPASTEHSHGQGSVRASKTGPLQGRSPHIEHLNPPRDVSPKMCASENNHKKALIENKNHRKKLVYGTTRTFNLRREKHLTAVKQRECIMTHIHNEVQSSKGTKKCPSKSNGNMKRTQKIEMESLAQNTTTMPKCASESVLESPEQDRKLQHISVYSPGVARQDDATNETLPGANQAESLSEKSSTSSGRSSRRSLLSDSSVEGTKEEDYADDFNSFEPSDADGTSSSLEPVQAEPPSALVIHSSDSGTESVQERALLPAPIRARSPLQRVLRGTHIIRTLDTALSLSSDEEDKEGRLQTVHSYKAKEGGSEAWSLTSLRGQRSESDRSSSTIQKNYSLSECSDLLEAEEMEDELGSLDFRKEYQHISELVACKLPGYTM
ncbi:microtubule-associated protein 10 [Nerophis ophidion]|uniref:microtubule-associated protein 10 n=1 Tax=Nerophis ophidion TaxID=159077 RepID=UPI002AE025F3|nr:microtubule-associated protein 10 [Nerophis ophidion]